MLTTRELQDEIIHLKKEKDICILAHAYQSHDIWEVADYVGDSYGLSVQAAKAAQSTVLMCGVRFMAETVKVLSPDKKVLLSSGEAGCPMAEQLSVLDPHIVKNRIFITFFFCNLHDPLNEDYSVRLQFPEFFH